MDEKCLFCQELQDHDTSVFLADNMDKFENLMEANEFDKNIIANCLICEECNNKICNFFDFKSSFMEKEDELLNYVNFENKVDLCDVLVTTGRLEMGKCDDLLTVQICRICFESTKMDSFGQITSYETKLAKVISTCLPEFDMFITYKTFICPECNSNLLKFYHFLLSCIKAVEDMEESSKFVDPLALKYEPLDKCIKEKEESLSKNDLRHEQSLLVPAVHQKRGRGRPRKYKIESPGNPKLKKIQIKQTIKTKNIPTLQMQPNTIKTFETAVKVVGKPRKKEYTSRKEIKTRLKRKIAKNCYLSYECQICPGVFDSFEALSIHIKCHRKQKVFSCWKCGEPFCTLSLLRSHFEVHGLEIFKIVEQEKESSDDEAVIKRRAYKKRADKPEKGKRKYWINLAPTDKVNHDDYFECQLCLQRLPSFPFFQRHIDVHVKYKKFNCLKCSYHGPSIIGLQRHMESDHHISSIYKIIRCNQMSDGDPEVNKALSTTEKVQSPATKSLHCSSCSQNFDSMGDILLHTCSAEKEYCCGHCSGLFYSLDELDVHICTPNCTESGGIITNNLSFKNAHATTSLKRTQEDGTEEEMEADYECSFCLLTFFTLKALDNHNCAGDIDQISYLKNDQEIICPKCSAKFDSSNNLSTHTCANIVSGPFENKGTTEQLREINAADSSGISTVKQSDHFQCFYCYVVFGSYDDFSVHCCTNNVKDVATESSQANNLNEDALQSTTFIKKESRFECYCCHSVYDSYIDFSEHTCNKLDSSIEENIKHKETVVKQENKLECSYCNARFDNSDELNIHSCQCTLLTEPDCFDADHNTEKNDVDESSPDLLTKDVQIPLNTRKNEKKAVDFANSKGGKLSNGENTPLEKPSKKEVINKIANMFGVKIVNRDSRDKQHRVKRTFDCIGCNFKTFAQRDLWFHVNYCEKVKKCNYCSYSTNISQKLEMHCYTIHDIIMFVCGYCRFMTTMEENFKVHRVSHGDALSDEVLWEEDALDEKSNEKNIVRADNEILTNQSSKEEVKKSDYGQNIKAFINPIYEVEETNSSVEENEILVKETDREVPNNVAQPVWLIEESSSIQDNFQNPSDEDEATTDENCFILPDRNTPDPICIPNKTTVPKDDLQSKNSVGGSKSKRNNDNLPHLEHVQDTSELIPPNAITKNKCVDTAVLGDTTVIDIDSDSDNEFIESTENKIVNSSTVVKEIRAVNSSEAFTLINQGIPVVNKSSLNQEQINFLTEGVSDNRGNFKQYSIDDVEKTDFPENPIALENSQDSNKSEEQDSDGSSIFVTDSDSDDKDHVSNIEVKIGTSNSNRVNPAPRGNSEMSDDNDKMPDEASRQRALNTLAVNKGHSVVGSVSHKSTKTSAEATKSKPRTENSKNKSSNINKKARTVKTVVRNNCIIIVDDEIDESQKKQDKSSTEIVEKSTHDCNDMTLNRNYINQIPVDNESGGTNQESDDDCVMVTVNIDGQEPKTLETVHKTAINEPMPNKVKKPPNAFRLFYEKVMEEIIKKFPNIKRKEQRAIILRSWRGMPDKDKWPFLEEARLHRLLFKREHPELCPILPKRKRRQKSVQKEACVISNHLEQSGGAIEEIVLD